MWGWGNLTFLSTQGFFNNIYSPFTDIYQHLSNPKTTKVKLPYQIKSSGNQPNPIVLKTAKQNTNPSEITMYCNYWNYITQRKTVFTTLFCLLILFIQTPLPCMIPINPSNPMMFSRIKLLSIVLTLNLNVFLIRQSSST